MLRYDSLSCSLVAALATSVRAQKLKRGCLKAKSSEVDTTSIVDYTLSTTPIDCRFVQPTFVPPAGT